MGKQPAVLIITRHGARLDQSDKEWNTRSDQPWDTPLSYGGWIQSQSLGARIATELSQLDQPRSSDGSSRNSMTGNTRPLKRRKITIHSSPYLRCIQTSIAIAAGLRHPQDISRGRPIPTAFQRSSLSRPPLSAADAASPPNDDFLASSMSSAQSEQEPTELKIDAWLGEWQSEGSYRPPPSEALVKAAKELLKKPSEEIKGADFGSDSIQEFDEFDWADKQRDMKDPKAIPIYEKTGLRAMAAKGYSMPRRTKTLSLSGRESVGSNSSQDSWGRRPRSTSYSPPVPTYSVSPQQKIPIGFVAHARDSCIDTDFDWDSEQPPLAWGDGGQYEEEWPTMHRRFQRGLQGLLSYYETRNDEDMEMDDEEVEEVVVLVTHQAGCNALIYLVTGAPALLNIDTSSLTLAVRKPGLTRQESVKSGVSPTRRRRPSLDLGINDDFEMRIIASTEHLRSGSNPLGLNSPRLGKSPAFASRRAVGADSADGFSLNDPLSWRSSSQTTIGRTSSVRSRTGGSISTESLEGSGLWSLDNVRSNSISSDISIDPWTPPNPGHKASSSNVSTSTIHEDETIEDWPATGPLDPQTNIVSSPAVIDTQSTWQPSLNTSPKRVPVRSGSTRLSGNFSAGTGLWGSPITNPGGVKEGTPHSRGSFGMSDASAPMWGHRAKNSWQNSRREFNATKEEDEDDSGAQYASGITTSPQIGRSEENPSKQNGSQFVH